MIPKLLILKNFLSYREVALDFDGLHVACVCGPNGAGKSSLLEAIAWCVWGQSRVSTEDDIIRQGATEAQVSFCFEHGQQTYRIIRTRRRNQASALEFQIASQSASFSSASLQQAGHPQSIVATEHTSVVTLPTFKTLTQKGVRATQQYILAQLKIDYETFVNAAYLRQGRADEFMLKRPSERKQVLADLLKLDRYDTLAEQAKEQSRNYKAQLYPLETLLDSLTQQIETQATTQQAYEQLQSNIELQLAGQHTQHQKISSLQQQQQQRSHWQQQLSFTQQSYQQQQTTTRFKESKATLETAQQQLKQLGSHSRPGQRHSRAHCAQDSPAPPARRTAVRTISHLPNRSKQASFSFSSRSTNSNKPTDNRISQLKGQLAQLQAQAQECQSVLWRKKKTSLKN